MNKETILKLIKDNFNGNPYDVMIENISKAQDIELSKARQYVNDLIDDGILCNTSKKKIYLSESVGLKRGLLQITKNGAGFLLNESGEDIFIPKNLLKGAVAGDTIWVKQDYERGKYISRGKVVQIVKHSITKVVGKIDILKNVAFVRPDNKIFTKDIVVPIQDRKSVV